MATEPVPHSSYMAEEGEAVSGKPSCTSKATNSTTNDVKRNQRQSATVQLQLKVLRRGMERLSSEKKELKTVLKLLHGSVMDLEKEIAIASNMKDIAERCVRFQNGDDGSSDDDYADEEMHASSSTSTQKKSISGGGTLPTTTNINKDNLSPPSTPE